MASAIDGVHGVLGHADDELDVKSVKMAAAADDEYVESPDEIQTNDRHPSLHSVHKHSIPSPEFADDFDVDCPPTMHYVTLVCVDLVRVEPLKFRKIETKREYLYSALSKH